MRAFLSALALSLVAAGALTTGAEVAPAPREKPTDDEWLPKFNRRDVDFDNKKRTVAFDNVKTPTAFPEVNLPPPDAKDPEGVDEYVAAFNKRCPRLTGATVLKIEATDTTFQKVLKARLHRGVIEQQQNRQPRVLQCFQDFEEELNCSLQCLADMQAAAAELWAEQPKELVLWLEELLLLSKELERGTQRHIELGGSKRGIKPGLLDTVARHRLKVEADLWKAKNGK